MAIEADVLVVGGGLAGSMAALAAADAGASVRLVSRRQSTLRQASGLVDVLGYRPEGDARDGPLVDPFAHLADLPAGHPYRTVGEDAVREALDRFDALAGDRYAGDDSTTNALVPTVAGTVTPTARYPRSMAAGLASRDSPCHLVDVAGSTSFDAPLAAARLDEAGVPFSVSGSSVPFPGVSAADATRTRFATALDHDEDEARAALAERVRQALDGAERVGFPAMLGLERPTAVRSDLEDALGARVFEVPTGPPSVPGIRLQRRLVAALRDAGVRLERGTAVEGFSASDGRVDSVRVSRGGTSRRATAFVLATGGLVGGGVVADRTHVSEPVFGCHVDHPPTRADWTRADVYGDHPFARFGVETDADLRPVGPAGRPEFDNLHAAGGVLAGANAPAENSGAGVSLATGLVAGRRAAEGVT